MDRKKILLIDDSEEAHVIFKLFLKGLFCDVISAYSADEGLALLKSQPFSLVFLDQVMPEKEGPACAREIREWERTARATPVRIIALTGLSEPGEQQRALDAGCDEVWVKPIAKDRLRALVGA